MKSIDIIKKLVGDITLKQIPKNYGIIGSVEFSPIIDLNTNIDITEPKQLDFIIDYIKNIKVKKVICVIRTFDDPFLDVECPRENVLNYLKEQLNKHNISFYKFIQEPWPTPVPKFMIEDDMFVLRFGFDESCFIDKLAVDKNEIQNFSKNIVVDSKNKKSLVLFYSDGVLENEI